MPITDKFKSAVANHATDASGNVTLGQKSARQQMMTVNLPTATTKWQSGGTLPTTAEVYGKIGQISKTNPEEGMKLWNTFSTYQQTPGNPYYAPQNQVTNKHVAAISELASQVGIDMTGGITDKWLQDNSWLQQYYRYENGTTPLAPTAKSSTLQNAAYHYYQILKAEEGTKKAETEWQALQDEIKYWVGRTDLNLSDDEVLGKIDWSNYKSLTNIDDNIALGTGDAINLNRALGYSKDALNGVVWAARNNGGTGNMMADSVKALNKEGNQYVENAGVKAKLDPSSSEYAPYTVAGTLDDAMLYFGVSSFDENWLASNRSILSGNDATAIKYYQQVAAAEDTTLKIEEEYAELQKEIATKLKYTTNADSVLKYIDWSEYPTLTKMDDSLRTGKLISTTRAVGYSRNGVEDYIRTECAKGEQKTRGSSRDLSKTTETTAQNAEPEAGTYGPSVPEYAKWMSYSKTLGDVAGKFSGAQAEPEAPKDEKTIEDVAGQRTGGHVQMKGKEPKDLYSQLQESNGKALEAIMASDVVQKAMQQNAFLDRYALDISQFANASEKIVLETGRDVLFYQNVGSVAETLAAFSAKPTGEQTAAWKQSDIEGAAGIVTMDYLGMLSVVLDYEEAQAKEAELKASIAEMESIVNGVMGGTPMTAAQIQKYSPLLQKYGGDWKALFDSEYMKAVTELNKISPVVASGKQEYERNRTNIDMLWDGANSVTAAAVQDGLISDKTPTAMDYLTYGFQLTRTYGDVQKWSTLNRFDSAMLSGYDRAQAVQYADNYIKAYSQQGQILDDVIAFLDECVTTWGNSNATDMVSGTLKNLKDIRTAITNDLKAAEYFKLQGNEGYLDGYNKGFKNAYNMCIDYNNDPELNVQVMTGTGFYGTAAAILSSTTVYNPNTGTVVQTRPYTDVLPDIREIQAVGGHVNQNALLSSYMTQDEQCNFFYLYKTEGKDKAMEYYDYLTDPTYGILTVRRSQALSQEVSAMPTIAQNAFAIMTSPARLVGSAYTLVRTLQGQDINPYSQYFDATVIDQTAQASTAQDILDAYNGNTNSFMYHATSLGYGVVKSILESTYNAFLFGGVAKAGGALAETASGAIAGLVAAEGTAKGLKTTADVASKLVKFIFKAGGDLISAAPMGAEAAAAAAREAAINNADPEQVLGIFMLTLCAETATEAITIDNIAGAFASGAAAGDVTAKSFKTLVKDWVKDSFEEGFGEMINEAVEYIGEDVILGALGSRQQYIDSLVKAGHTQLDAQTLANFEFFNQVFEAGISGMLSSYGTNLAGYTAGYAVAGAKYATQQAAFKILDHMVEKYNMNNVVTNAEQETATNNTKDATKPAPVDTTTQNTTNQTGTQNETKPVVNPVEGTQNTTEGKDETKPVTAPGQEGEQKATDETKPTEPAVNPAEGEKKATDETKPAETAQEDSERIRFQPEHRSNTYVSLTAVVKTLQNVANGTPTEQATAIAGILSTVSKGCLPQSSGEAAAQLLVSKFGKAAIGFLQDLATHGTNTGVGADGGLRLAVFAMLLGQDSESYKSVAATIGSLYNEDGTRKTTTERVVIHDPFDDRASDLNFSVWQETHKDGAADKIRKTITESRVANATIQQASETMKATEPQQKNVEKAQEKADNANEALGVQQDRFNAIQQEVKDAGEALVQDPGNKNRAADVSAAAGRAEKQATVVGEYQQSAANAKEGLDSAKADLQTAQADAMNAARAAGLQSVAQQDAARAEAKAKAEAQAKADAADAVKAEKTGANSGKSTTDVTTTPQENNNTVITDAKTPGFLFKKNKGANKSAQSIMTDLANNLGMILQTRMGKYKRGLKNVTRGYTRQNGVAHVKDAQNFNTALHEIFHNIDKALDLQGLVAKSKIGSMEALKEAFIKAFPTRPGGQSTKAWLDQYNADDMADELIAQFGRLYMQVPKAAEAFAGKDFVDQFEALLKQKKNDNGSWYDSLQQARIDLQHYTQSSIWQRKKASISNEPVRQAPRKSLSKTAEHICSVLFDYTAPFERMTLALKNVLGSNYKASEDPRILMLMKESLVANMAECCIVGKNGQGMVDLEGNAVLDKDGNAYGTFSEVFDAIKPEDMQDLMAYWLTLSELEGRSQQGKAVFSDELKVLLPVLGQNPGETYDVYGDHIVRQIDRLRPQFRETVEKAEEWYTAFMKTWLVDTNIISQDLFDTMRSMYKYYIPTFRVKEADRATAAVTSQRDNSSKNPIKGSKGGTQDIYNPIMSMAEYIQNYIAYAKELEIKRAFDTAMRLFMDINMNGEDSDETGVAVYNKNAIDKRGPTEGRNNSSGLNGKNFFAWGLENFAEPADNAMHKVDNTGFKQQAMAAINRVLNSDGAQFTADEKDAILNSIEQLPDAGFVSEPDARGGDVINILREDGSIGRWTIHNSDVLKALLPDNTKGPEKMVKFFNNVGKLTKFLCANSTSRSIGFTFQNVASDVETAMNTADIQDGLKSFFAHGTLPGIVANEAAALIDTIRNMVNEKTGNDTTQQFKNFGLFGQMGSRYAFSKPETRKTLRKELNLEKQNKAIKTLKNVVLAPVLGIQNLSDLLEDTTRYNVFRAASEKYDTSTYSGRLLAGKAAMDATTNFSMHGNATATLGILKNVIPFIGAQMQGVYKTAKTFSSANAGNRAKTAARIVVNSLITQGVISALRGLTWDDDEKEAYEMMTPYERNKYFHIKLADGTFIRVKKSQDALIQAADAFGEVMGAWLTGYEDNPVSELLNLGGQIVKNSLWSFDTIFDPITNAADGETWYGSSILSYNEQQMSTTAGYDTDTTYLARALSVWLDGTGVQFSPKAIDYMFQQYTGSFGKIAHDVSVAFQNNGLGSGSVANTILSGVYTSLLGKFTVDPIKTNGISTEYYNGKTMLSQIIKEADADRIPQMLRGDLTEDEMVAAYNEAKTLTSTKGELGVIASDLKVLWKAANAIESGDKLTGDNQSYALKAIENERTRIETMAQMEGKDYKDDLAKLDNLRTAVLNGQIPSELRNDLYRVVRKDINSTMIKGNQIIGKYESKYCYTNGWDKVIGNTAKIFDGGSVDTDRADMARTYDAVPTGLMNPTNKKGTVTYSYVDKCNSMFSVEGKSTALPAFSSTMTLYKDGVKGTYTVSEDDPYYDEYVEVYQNTMQQWMLEWDDNLMTDEQKYAMIKKAKEKANLAVKAKYAEKHGMTTQK